MGNKIIITGGSGFIGTHLIDILMKNPQNELLNIDFNKPVKIEHLGIHVNADIRENLEQIFQDFKPDFLIHLAAEADVNLKSIDEYSSNIGGVENIVSLCNKFNVKKALFFSTQYVYQDYADWEGYDTYNPFTVYGESKMRGERIVKEECKVPFLILRPTNIWGENNLIYVEGLFKILEKGYYFHPKTSEPVIRSYGYVRNICHQAVMLLKSVEENRVFYLSDEPIELSYFVTKLGQEINGKVPKYLPMFMFKVLATIGDLMRSINIGFPMNSVRLHNMVHSNPVPIQDTIEITGDQPFSLQEAIRNTISWYKSLDV